ncbi:thioredoxin domain-containing protein [Thioalkalivibrio sulfidiphilus]|uniref:thioredoxin domain-containing protein n=1 Tax=Thioalkalivibrio sulfidiphilus TaxID=1033854 RepID=UPI000361A75A|nr:thioredoxin domain-containing protein [Thioalkalivibrio sulfidiphilus]
MPEQTSNRLANETSPYLLQHVDNPVDWYPWGPEALEKAKREDKPILLSIGYSACHWCHVMAHESFEDPATAQVMNRLYVNIKVDREERPDLDKIYQTAHFMLSQRSGGWPLTMFLTPDQVPFFGGTYFPDAPRHGLPAFRDLLERIAGFYHERRDEIERQNASLQSALTGLFSPRGHDPLNSAVLDTVRSAIAQQFDERDGGFGTPPKFPHPSTLERLLRHYAQTGDERARYMACFTLEKMARGGLNDQLAGGFCRYSTDGQWMIPHFEKMLYDNGPLLALYAQAYAATGDAYFADVAGRTAAWAVQTMQSPEGGFYSALDADSEGEEGRYYVWSPEEVRKLVPEEVFPVFARVYGLDRGPNFEGRWHLHTFVTPEQLAKETGSDEAAIEAMIEATRAPLLAARAKRVPPGLDDKILTSWNALMIRGLAVAARHLARISHHPSTAAADLLAVTGRAHFSRLDVVSATPAPSSAPRAPSQRHLDALATNGGEICGLGRREWIDAATRAMDFIRANLWRDGRLLATYKNGSARLPAYLDDHAYLLDALLELLQVRWRTEHLGFAREIADILLSHFEDREQGGFFFTADDHEALIQRPKTFADEAMPSGNGVAALALNRLGHLLGEPRYVEAAERTVRLATTLMDQAPMAHASLISAFEEQLYLPKLVILRGAPEAMAAWHGRLLRDYAPRRLVFAIPADASDLPEALAAKAPKGEAVAYVCTGTSCSAPVMDLDALLEQLG